MIRLSICQPALPHYRVPLFDTLGADPRVELTVFAPSSAHGFDYEHASENFTFTDAPVQTRRFGHFLQPAMYDAVDPERFDVAILPWNVRFRSLGPAMRHAHRGRVGVILWGHGVSKKENIVRRAYRNIFGRAADAVLLYTPGVAQALIQRDEYNADEVFVAPNAMDQRPIQAARSDWLARPDDLADFQKTHRLDPQRTFIAIGRLEPANRFDLAAQAVASIPDARLIIIGDGPARDAIAQAGKTAGGDVVHFTGPLYEQSDIAPWMLSAAAMIYPSNCGLAALHAMGFALPVVAGDRDRKHGPEIEAVTHDQTGIRFRHDNLTSLKNALIALMDDPTRRDRLADAAHQRATTEWTIPKMVDAFIDAAETVRKR